MGNLVIDRQFPVYGLWSSLTASDCLIQSLAYSNLTKGTTKGCLGAEGVRVNEYMCMAVAVRLRSAMSTCGVHQPCVLARFVKSKCISFVQDFIVFRTSHRGICTDY